MQLVTDVLLKKQRMRVDQTSKGYYQRKPSEYCCYNLYFDLCFSIDSSGIITTIVPDDITRIQVCVKICTRSVQAHDDHWSLLPFADVHAIRHLKSGHL